MYLAIIEHRAPIRTSPAQSHGSEFIKNPHKSSPDGKAVCRLNFAETNAASAPSPDGSFLANPLCGIELKAGIKDDI